MNILPPIQEGFYRWIDSVAGTVNGLLNRLQSNHEVGIIEEAPDTFRLHAPAAGRRSHLADHRIRIVGDAIKDRLPAGWAKMLRGSRAEIVLQANRFPAHWSCPNAPSNFWTASSVARLTVSRRGLRTKRSLPGRRRLMGERSDRARGRRNRAGACCALCTGYRGSWRGVRRAVDRADGRRAAFGAHQSVRAAGARYIRNRP
jgi:hypothetical protein